MDFYTYIYLDPKNFEPFYVGKGSGERYKIDRHLNGNKNCKFVEKIKKVGCENILIKIIPCADEQDAFKKEILFIKEIGRNDLKLGTLLNLTDGGEGWAWNKAQKKRKSLQMASFHKKFPEKASNYRRGKSHSEETKNLMRKAKIGVKSPSSILEDRDVKRIKRDIIGSTVLERKKIAEKLNVSVSTINDIYYGHTWVHIE